MKNFAVYELCGKYLQVGYDGEYLTDLLLKNECEGGERTTFTHRVYTQICEYFNHTRQKFDLPIKLSGTPFQQSVWSVLEKIPYGETLSYSAIAERIGRRSCCRAVGAACSKNRIWIVIPCHRAVGKDGKLVGYAGGIEIKAKLLELEGSKYE